MEQAQNILDKVSMFFAELVGNESMPMPSGETAAPAKMMEAKLKDGTIVEVSELAVGGIVTIEGVPAPVGEHMLESGEVILLGDNGVIMEIKPSVEEAPVAETPVVEDMSAKFAAFESATNEKFTAYESKFAQYEIKLGQANKVIEGLMQISKMLVEAPQAAPDASVKTSNAFADQKIDAKRELDKFSKSICS
jgi:uncharacterized short protein YbdD (DUF466 family)